MVLKDKVMGIKLQCVRPLGSTEEDFIAIYVLDLDVSCVKCCK